MKFLISNDDGYDAPGIAALTRSASAVGHTTVVAPEDHLSGCSHRINTYRALEIREIDAGRYALDGTPADCARIGLWDVAADCDWVLSGVNDGGNLGVDTILSGTVAAVREAAMHGKPGIAFSQYRNDTVDWEMAEQAVARMLGVLLELRSQPRAFWNVNFPDWRSIGRTPNEVDIVFCDVDLSPTPLNYVKEGSAWQHAAVYSARPRVAGGDVEACFTGNIAVSEIVPASTVDHSARNL